MQLPLQLSSRLTIVLRLLLPGALALAGAAVAIWSALDAAPDGRLAISFFLLLMAAIAYLRNRGLAGVVATRSGMVVSRGRRTTHVPYLEIATIKQLAHDRVRVRLLKESLFGWEIVFAPWTRFFSGMGEHPAVSFLKGKCAADAEAAQG